ncbi:hypothetical protein, partial [Salmonella enterica]|uniref:hypothetical protein n=1 Tax=Salmonella enterica TaxID=28901 RepID=UPI0018C89179
LQALLANELEDQRREVAELERTDPDALVGEGANAAATTHGAGASGGPARRAHVAAIAGGLALAALVYVLAGRRGDDAERAVAPTDSASGGPIGAAPSPPDSSTASEPP